MNYRTLSFSAIIFGMIAAATAFIGFADDDKFMLLLGFVALAACVACAMRASKQRRSSNERKSKYLG